MNRVRNPFILGAIVVIAAVALFVVLEPDGSDESDGPVVTNSATGNSEAQQQEKQQAEKKPKPPPVPTVVVRNGEPVDGVLGIEVEQGDTITFRVESDVDEEVHVHGFDITEDVAAGGAARLSFPATITGIFEVELEYSGVPVAELQVSP